jgi:hypothetical protein
MSAISLNNAPGPSSNTEETQGGSDIELMAYGGRPATARDSLACTDAN